MADSFFSTGGSSTTPAPAKQNPTQTTNTSGSKTGVLQNPNSAQSFDISGILYPLLYVVLALIAVTAASYTALEYFKKSVYKKKIFEDWNQTAIIEISVPKDTAEQVQKDGGGKGSDKETLAIGEQIFAILSDYSQKGWKFRLFGGERFSLEIVNIDQETRFWLGCRADIAEVIEKQILAVYPKGNIVRLQNPDFFKPDTFAFAQELELGERYELPFRTYKNMDQEPLNTITNTLSGLTATESAAIQLVITPIREDWQKNPRILAAKIQQGQSPKEILYPDSGFKLFFKSITKELKKAIFPKKEGDTSSSTDRKIDLTGREQAVQLTPQQQEIIKKLEEKASRQGFTFSLRVIGSAATEERAKNIVDNIIPGFQIYENRPFNYFKKAKTDIKNSVQNFTLRAQNPNRKAIINIEEINSIWHLPNYLTQTSNIKWLLARKPPIPLILPNEKADDAILMGYALGRGERKPLYLKNEDRMRHIYALGGSGTGKSFFMTSTILHDIEAGNGICVVDPHGETVDDVLLRMPKHRIDDVIVLSPAITDFPLGLNLLETDPLKPTQKTLVINTLFSIWDKLYDLKTTGGPMFEQYMKNALRLIMSHPESGNTIMEVQKVMTDEDYRAFKLAMCDDQQVVDFWENVASKAEGEGSLQNMVPYFVSKLSPFVNNDFLRPMVGQNKSAVNMRMAMDNKKIILVKLEKGLIGEESAYLTGMVVVGQILLAGMGRNDGLKYNEDGTTEEISSQDRPPFFVYIDEMQNFLFDAIPQALEEIRKYKVGLFLAHQFVSQVVTKGENRIRDSIMNNCGNKFIFRVGAEDAKALEDEFAPTMGTNDIMNPERFTANCRVLIDGQKTTPFNISSYNMNNFGEPDYELKKQIIQMTKDKYGTAKAVVEQEIKERGKLLF
jgi:TraM recognition site of TraD and TraG